MMNEPVTMSLDEDDDLNGNITTRISIANVSPYHNFVTLNGTVSGSSVTNTTTTNISNYYNSNCKLYDWFYFSTNDGSSFVDEGYTLSIDITNLLNYVEIINKSDSSVISTNNATSTGLSGVQVFLYDISGTSYDFGWLSTQDFKFSGSKYTLSLDLVDVPFDVYKISMYVNYNFQTMYNISDTYLDYNTYRITRYLGFSNSNFQFSAKETDKTSGLLATIIEWLTNIRDNIVNLPSKIADGIKGFFDNVVNAVVNLGNTILDGIKNLFIPSEEDITKMKDKWDTLLSDRFGALYQVASLISDYATAFTEQSKGTILFPSVSIPLAGAEFTFGGWEVQIVPDGFEIVFDTLKLITSILATFLFVNGMKKRFDKLLGGADDI